MEKLHADELTGVSETLLIPLHFRVQESRKESSAFRDEMGERFHNAIEYDWSKLQAPFFSQVMAARTTILDNQVRIFLAKAPDGIIVNLGAGLDTRFYRLDNGIVRWIELDLPGVISFRRQLQEPLNDRHRLVAGSVLDDGWIAETHRDGEAKVLLIAEGLLPYFSEEEHRKIFGYLAEHFRGQEMLFQTSAPSLTEELVQYSVLSKMSTNVELRWGLDDSAQVSLLDPRVRFIREFPLLEGRYDSLPEQIRARFSPEAAMRVAKIVRVRFQN